MAKNKLGFGAYMSIVAGILAIVACVLYRTVMYQYQPVFYMLIGAAVLAVVGLLIAKSVPTLANYIPILMVFLLFSAIVWGSMLMVNQIGYVIAGLDGVDTILSYFIFVGFTLAAGVVALIAAFLRTGEKA
ncbi:MAG: hypothetical protein IIY90_07515 [Oscillospiraceae bacterium]|jgi:hypothetical protein|nr:hypothetical protein [Oscillospiraceae bacterium]